MKGVFKVYDGDPFMPDVCLHKNMPFDDRTVEHVLHMCSIYMLDIVYMQKKCCWRSVSKISMSIFNNEHK